MNQVKRRIAAVALAAAVGAVGTRGMAADREERSDAATPSITELKQQIEALQRQVEKVEARQAMETPVLNGGDLDAAVGAVMDDTRRRSQFLAVETGVEPPTAGHERGKFFIRSTDGNFAFSPTFQLQLRNVTNWRDVEDNGSDIENGFELRRTKFGAEGHAFTKDLSYKFVWATNRSGGSVFLEDAIVTYKLNSEWSVFGGQFKDPVHHEELTSSSKQLAADRSLVNEMLGGGMTDRVQGLGLGYKKGQLNATFAFHDGANSDNTNFRDSTSNDADYGAAGRVEFTVFGDNKGYGDFSARKNKSDMLVLGLGGDVTGGAEANAYFYTADAQWENTGGTGIYGAVMGMTVNGHGDRESATDWGALAQVAQMLSDKWEVFGRVGYIDPDDDGDIYEITAGLNYYMFDHNAKLTLDLVYLPEGSPSDSGLGYLGSGDEKQVVGRIQFQLAL